MVKRVCLVSSGTGGHLLPAVTLAQALARCGHEPTLLTEGRAVESDLLDRCSGAEGRIPARSLHVGRAGLGLPLRLAQATVEARRFLRAHDVDLLVGAGGRTTVPAILAARSLGKPVFLLEQNVVTGRANRLLAPLARRIYFGLPPLRSGRRGLVTGTPLRPGVGRIARDAARRSLGFAVEDPVVMVTGGSQGARVLNETIPTALDRVGRRLQVIHLAGQGKDVAVKARYDAMADIVAVVRAVVLDMATLYAAADLVICRGGGGTIAELMQAGRAALIVPYPHHRDRQQWHNGQILARAGAARVCREAVVDPDEIADWIAGLLARPDRRRRMEAAADSLAPGDACQEIVADMRRMGALD